MNDLISRGKLLGVIKPMVGIWYDETFWIDYKRVIDIIENLPSAEPEPEDFEWCHGCKEYDQEKHCCHRWTKVIRNTIEEIKTKYWRWIPVTEALPEEKGEYLVSYHPCHWSTVSEKVLVGMDTFRGKTTWAKKKYQKVIAWMPLPEPYEVTNENASRNN